MTAMIASSTEEQASVAEEINQNINRNKQPRSKLRGISRRNNLNRQDAKDAKF